MAKEKQGQEDLKDKAKDSKKNTGSKEKDNWKEYTYKVKGMHCPSCELAIERRLLREDGVEFVDASVSKGEVYVQYSKSKPSLSRLGHLFDSDDYTFCKMDDSSGTKTNDANNSNSEARVTCDNAVLFQKVDNKLLINKHLMRQYGYSFVGALLVILIFYILQRSGITSGFSVNEDSALGMFVLFGMVAGLSSCAALVGGLVLSMSKQWSQMYRDSTNFGGQYTPHILFNLGRLLSFGVFGAMLGGLGSIFSVSLQLSAVLAMLVSILMIVLSLQMLEVPFFKTIRLGLGKFISRWAMKKEKIDSPLGPFLLGAVTFFLPCGFTVTAQSAALISGSAFRGGLITFFFALGTLPMLIFIGVTSSKLSRKKHLSGIFMKAAGILVMFFALYTFNSQLNLLGVFSLSDIKNIVNFSGDGSVASQEDLPEIDNEGYQVIEMSASSSGYSPNYFKVRAGVPVRWVITNDGVSGCTDAIISQNLFDGEVPIDQPQVVKEFTPDDPGRYKFSCWMGMVTGTIDVIGENGELSQDQIESGSLRELNDTGGGCGCSGSCGGDCGNGDCPYAK